MTERKGLNGGEVSVRGRRGYFPTYLALTTCVGALAAQLLPWMASEPPDIALTVVLVLVVLWSVGHVISALRRVNRAPSLALSARCIRVSGISYEEEAALNDGALSLLGRDHRGPLVKVFVQNEKSIARGRRTRIFALDRAAVWGRNEPWAYVTIHVFEYDCDPVILLDIIRRYAPDMAATVRP